MTLDTSILIYEPTSHRELFEFCLNMVAIEFTGTPTWRYEEGHWHVIEKTGYKWWVQSGYATTLGQGLPGILEVRHADDSPLVYYDEDYIREIREERPDWQVPDWNEHLLHVSLDTAYGYRHPRTGASCGDLHAWFVRQVVLWLEDRDVTKVTWQDECSGEWYTGVNDVGVLGDPNRGALRVYPH